MAARRPLFLAYIALVPSLVPAFYHASPFVAKQPRQEKPGGSSRLRVSGVKKAAQARGPHPRGLVGHAVAVAEQCPPEEPKPPAPKWAAPAWVPAWAQGEIPILLQCLLAFVFYLVHTLVLSRHVLPFPVQLIPNNEGLFQSIGLDTLAGVVAIGMFASLKRPNRPLPWSIGRRAGLRRKALWTTAVLAVLHFMSGYLSLMLEYLLYGVAAAGVPMTVAMHRSLQVRQVETPHNVCARRTHSRPFTRQDFCD